MRIKIVKKAEAYFAPYRYTQCIGKPIRVRKRNGVRGLGLIVGAKLSDDKTTVELTVEME